MITCVQDNHPAKYAYLVAQSKHCITRWHLQHSQDCDKFIYTHWKIV